MGGLSTERSSFGEHDLASTHFARVSPVVGSSLQRVRVGLLGLPEAAPIVTYLAANGVGRWLLLAPPPPALPGPDGTGRAARSGAGGSPGWAGPGDGGDVRAQHGAALALEAVTVPLAEWAVAVRASPPDLVIAVGDAKVWQAALRATTSVEAPALLIGPPTATHPCQAVLVFPGDPMPEVGRSRNPAPAPPDPWGWTTAAPLCAGLARAILLRDTPFRRADLAELWGAGVRTFTFADPADPFIVRSFPLGQATTLDSSPPSFCTPGGKRGTLLIVGLGSLGSVAAMHLLPYAASLVLVDPDHVSPYNPVRQAYPLATVGRPKAHALRAGLLGAGAEHVVSIAEALRDEHTVEALVARYKVTAALVVTGTEADFPIARALRACDVPHVIGRCYPRARYWEAILVDGERGPAFEDIRGRLRLGPAPPPTPEQIAAYSQAGALEAEPATLIESGWAATWMARLTAQLLAPPGLRERWLLELLAAERTCLIGGVGVEPTATGPAYGVAQPGAIHAWGRGDLAHQE